MNLCPKCERPYEGDPDFCPSCGEYLRWDPTGYHAAVDAPAAPAPQAPPPAAPPPARPGQHAHAAPAPAPAAPQAAAPQAAAPPQPDPVLLALRRPGDEGYATETLQLRVPPGGSVEVLSLVRNQSGIVDNYDVTVDGMPDGWWEVAPATVYLVPYGSPQGTYEQEVTVRVSPPRSPEAEARAWPVSVVATSRANPAVRVAAPCGVEVEPYAEIATEVSPERRGGRVQARFEVAVSNLANAPVEVALAAVDPEDALGFEFQRPPTARAGTPIDPARVAEKGMNAAQRFGADALDPGKMAKRAVADLKAGGGNRAVRGLLRKKPAGPRVHALRIGPGERAETVLVVSPPKQIWIGRGVLRPFQVTPQPLDAGTPAPPAAATLNHRPWLPWWMAIVIPLLVIAGIWFLMSRPDTVTVPDLREAPDAFAADGILKEAGLVLEKPPTEVPAGEAAPGSIVEQVPAAGETVDKGATVAIKIAVAAERVPVPDLQGKTLAEAGPLLQQAGLQLGPPDQPPADPATAVIATQAPLAGQEAAKGSPVAVAFEQGGGAATAPTTAVTPTAPVPAGGGGSTTAPAPTSTGGGGGPGLPPATAVPAVVPPRQPDAAPPPPPPDVPTTADGNLLVPNLAEQDRAAAEASLTRAGLVPSASLAYDGNVPAGRVVAQDPAPDTAVARGSSVKLVVSLGEPEVIYDNNNDLFRVSGVDGSQRSPLMRTPDRETQASISRDGRMLAYRSQPDPADASSAQIWLMDLTDPRNARPLTNTGFNDRRPAISPDGAAIAFVSNRDEADTARGLNLCFVKADANASAPACIADPDTGVSRPTWSPDGRSIVVTATQGPATAPEQLELLEYTSSVPNSANPADWVKRSFVTDGLHGDRKGDEVFSAAYSPDGTRLAFTADWGGGVPSVRLLAVGANGVIGDQMTELQRAAGCEISWRPDGGELVVSRRGAECRDGGQVGRVDLRTGDFDPLTPAGGEGGNPVFVPVG